MTKPTWKTGSAVEAKRRIIWPTLTQAIKQAGILLAIVLLWGGALFGFVTLTAAEGDASPPEAPQVAVEPTFTLVPTSLPTPTETSTSTPVPLLTDQPAPETATPAPTDTPISPTKTPTEVPIPDTPAPAVTPEDASIAETSFQTDVLPIFERRCAKCHGGEKVEEGLILLTYEDVMAGSFNGSVIEPGDVEGSYLIELIVSGDMPKRGARLLPAEIRTISAWVEAGAPNN